MGAGRADAESHDAGWLRYCGSVELQMIVMHEGKCIVRGHGDRADAGVIGEGYEKVVGGARLAAHVKKYVA